MIEFVISYDPRWKEFIAAVSFDGEIADRYTIVSDTFMGCYQHLKRIAEKRNVPFVYTYSRG